MNEERFEIVSDADKAFIIAFHNEMKALGYEPYRHEIGSGYCWGAYMIVYAKIGVKSKQVAARIYIRKAGIVLRLFLNQIDLHRGYIENAPPHIKDVFTSEYGNCKHCEGGHRKDGPCRFRKAYVLDGRSFEKCNGVVFEFWQPDLEKLPDYVGLLRAFYSPKRK